MPNNIKFETLDSIPDFDDAGDALPSDVRLCVDCNSPLPEYSGRGRKPIRCDDCKVKSKPRATSTRGSNQDVTKALTTMDTIYQGAIMMANLLAPKAAIGMAGNMAKAQELNKSAFEVDRKLARRVAALGNAGGIGAFIVAQGIMVSPIAIELLSRRQIKDAKAKPQPVTGKPVTSKDPDLSFFN